MASNNANYSTIQNLALLIGRILIAALFLVASYNKFKNLGGTTGYFTKLGFPSPSIAAPLVATIELFLGVTLVAGWKTRCIAIGVAAFAVIAALAAHTNLADVNQLNHFFKNLAIAGGCLALFVAGAGAYSMDGRRR